MLVDSPLSKNLVLDLPFSEGTGNIAYDRSPKQNHGEVTGGSWLIDEGMPCLELNGSSDFVSIPDDDTLRPPSFTIFLIFKILSWNTDWAVYLSKEYDGGNPNFRLRRWGSSTYEIDFAMADSGGYWHEVVVPFIYLDELYRVVWIYDGYMKILISNGDLVRFYRSDRFTMHEYGPYPIYIGRYDGGLYGNIRVYDLKIFSVPIDIEYAKILINSRKKV